MWVKRARSDGEDSPARAASTVIRGGLGLRGRILAIYAGLALFHVLAWTCCLATFHSQPFLFGAAVIAYTLGLRHGVDADHLAAIDNVTRRQMQNGRRPVTLGLFFALGHSTVVTAAFVAIALLASSLEGPLRDLRAFGAVLGTSVSAGFLLAIGVANAVVFLGVYRAFKRARCGEAVDADDLDGLLARRGLLGRLFRPVFALVSKSWHMYPVGFLFGLGFDTASEIAVLGLSATAAIHGLPIWSLLVFPAVFTAGMTLVDTSDNILMVGAYGWAFVKPLRKLYYNMTITLVSVVIALIIGGLEALGAVGASLGLSSGFWGAVEALNNNFSALGYVIVVVFVASWAVSAIIYRVGRFDEVAAPATVDIAAVAR
jgi:high-affinity nickel-transport protein